MRNRTSGLIAKASAGGEIASTFENPQNTKLGSCKLIEEIMIGEDKLIHFSGVEMGAACTIVLRGASKRLLYSPILPLHCPAAFQLTGTAGLRRNINSGLYKRGYKGVALAYIFRLPAITGTHVLDEAERSLHDALCVLSQTVQDSRVVYGGGWPEMQMAGVVQKQAARTPGKRSLAMEAFAHALRAIPATICDTAGIVSSSE